MIELPDFEKAFEYENNFYLSCDTSRIGKFIAQYELFMMSLDVPGMIVECGVFKGVSLARFAHFRELFGASGSKEIVGFDIFGAFPEAGYEADQELLGKFIDTAGNMSIDRQQMLDVLTAKGLSRNTRLIEGDVTLTLPAFVKENPGAKISFLNLDVDLYEPSKVVLETLYPLVSSGGVILLDDYGKFPGETRAADEYFEGKDVRIESFPFVKSPCYIIKP